MNNIFVLARSHYEELTHYYFEGPADVSQKDFRLLCDSLLEEAGYNAIVRANKDPHGGWVGWEEVVESMIPLLEKQGYRHFIVKSCTYNGSSIIESLDENEIKGLSKAGPAIIAHNKRLRYTKNEE